MSTRHLMGVDLPPVTRTLGWLRAPIDDVVTAYREWQTPIVARRGGRVEVVGPTGAPTVAAVVCRHLAPLVKGGSTRALFLPTRDGTSTVFVDNQATGTDAFPTCSLLSIRLGCAAARVVLAPDDPTVPTHGATILETYVPEDTIGINYGRVISAANDGGTWTWHVSGEPYAFEDTSRYEARRIRDRFTPDHLAEYLEHLDIPVLHGDRFDPKAAMVVERRGMDGTTPPAVPLEGC